jgi:hypothetical protein
MKLILFITSLVSLTTVSSQTIRGEAYQPVNGFTMETARIYVPFVSPVKRAQKQIMLESGSRGLHRSVRVVFGVVVAGLAAVL